MYAATNVERRPSTLLDGTTVLLWLFFAMAAETQR
jgi:hypothetical protein